MEIIRYASNETSFDSDFASRREPLSLLQFNSP